jgi:nucleotide-binding universal stress UspA family protein
MTRLRAILHPTDFSECSHHAFEVACSLTRDYGARLLLQHVRQPPAGVYLGAVVFPIESPGKAAAVRDRLYALEPSESYIAVEHHLSMGDPAAMIVYLAAHKGCDLIVMGTYGRSGLGHLILGSVAEQVVRSAPCPVLTVKPPVHAPSDQSAGAKEVEVSHAILS